MEITYQSNVQLHLFELIEQDGHYLISLAGNEDFFEVNEVAVKAIERIGQESLITIEAELKQVYPDEEIDILSFIEQLAKLGIVAQIDGVPFQNLSQSRHSSGWQWIPGNFAPWWLQRWTIPIFLICLMVNMLVFCFFPALLPVYQDLFVFDSMALNILCYALISLILVFLHELGHILAMRSFDLPVHMNIGNRLFLLVLESDLTPAWTLAKKEKNTIFLAGMLVEQLILSISLTLKILNAGTPLIQAFLSVIILNIFIKTIYQCCVFMKTDLYYVWEHHSGCYNLLDNSKNYLSRWLPFLNKDTSTEPFEGEEKTIKLYSIFLLLGVGLLIALFVFFFIPQAAYMLSQALSRLSYSVSNPLFWDAIVILGQFVLIGLLFIYLQVKRYKHKQ
ncbi:peptidase [Gracilibacillus alcaliphilus]|uniref:peptidase n=1 Tax=Gracilibacillus alcaliphilus TaxID=1401441 RepID=UPI0019566A62|nr:peptidase [Gracilibacillus alcaliphilus]MBM7675536.1 hypothetical protein [Gracilibacillus alcaliphilus]